MKTHTLPLFLASSSPRRRELLAGLGLPFSVVRPEVDERTLAEESPTGYVARLADAKAMAGQLLTGEDRALTLGSDTAVVAGGEVLGKPRDGEDALRMLKLLSGSWHEVHTAVTITDGSRREHALVTSRVRFIALTEADITAYWASGEPRDKAGGYAIQGLGAMFVERLEGSYTAVVGLPVCETVQLLSEWGLGIHRILGNTGPAGITGNHS